MRFHQPVPDQPVFLARIYHDGTGCGEFGLLNMHVIIYLICFPVPFSKKMAGIPDSG